jgi:hypothetical protein
MKAFAIVITALAAAQGAFAAAAAQPAKTAALDVSVPSFSGGTIPERYSSCRGGGNAAPSVTVSKIPRKAKTLALIMDDPDAPAKVWVHWTVFNIPVSSATVVIDGMPKGKHNPARQGANDYGDNRYDGPCPPSGTHHYVLHAYALDSALALPDGVSRDKLDAAINAHKLAQGSASAKYTLKSASR